MRSAPALREPKNTSERSIERGIVTGGGCVNWCARNNRGQSALLSRINDSGLVVEKCTLTPVTCGYPAQAPVEGFDVTVIRRLAGACEIELDTAVKCPWEFGSECSFLIPNVAIY